MCDCKDLEIHVDNNNIMMTFLLFYIHTVAEQTAEKLNFFSVLIEKFEWLCCHDESFAMLINSNNSNKTIKFYIKISII